MVNLLDIAPVRAAGWQEEGDRVVVERPRPGGEGLRRVWERMSYRLSPRRLRLDERGSFVWRALDGRRTVGEVAEAVRERFGTEAEPAEERVGQLVRTLRHEGLVAYPGDGEAC